MSKKDLLECALKLAQVRLERSQEIGDQYGIKHWSKEIKMINKLIKER